MKNYLYVLLFLLATNLVLNGTSFYMGLGRPIINIDYLLIFILFVYIRPYIITILLFIFLFIIYSIDILLLALQIFPFVRLTDILYLSNFVFNGPILYRIILLALIIHFIIIFFIIRDFFLIRIKLNFSEFIVLIFLVLMFLFTKHLLNPIEKDHVYARFEKSVYGSQLLFFVKHQNSSLVESVRGEPTTLEPNRFKYATQPLLEQLNNNQKELSNKILLIVNESWGETSKTQHQDTIVSPIYNLKKNLKYIHRGSFNFVGATVAGELRELCNLQPTTFNLKESKAKDYKGCIPNLLKNKGYDTHTIHGAMSIMYDRKYWYPMAGFNKMSFYEDLKTVGTCKSFSGRCDIELLPYVQENLLSQKKSFVYWLTLNTHAPYDDNVVIEGLDCKVLSVKEGSETCNNYKLQYQFFSSITELIKNPKMSGLEVYIVGDHSPPIFNLSDNFFSFKGSEVAWIHFKIK